jgi:hypothetical protein
LKPARIETHETIPLYVLFDGNKRGIYMNFEKISKEKLEGKEK